MTGRISGTVPASYCKSVSPQHHGSEVSYVCYVYRWPCPAMSTDNRGHPALHAGDRPLGETEIVLAYCSASLAWLMGTLDKLAQVGANVTRVNVVAKCGKKPRARPPAAPSPPEPVRAARPAARRAPKDMPTQTNGPTPNTHTHTRTYDARGRWMPRLGGWIAGPQGGHVRAHERHSCAQRP